MKTTLHGTPLRRPWAVWLAVLIAVLGSLAPTVTHALMPSMGQAAQGVEICTSDGPRWVAADAAASVDDSTPVPASATPPAHCQVCLQTTDRVASLDDPLPLPLLAQDGQRKPPVWQAVFCATAHAFAPPPRGPPDFF